MILVVEDDGDVRTLTVKLLEQLGYRTCQAGDGPTALNVLEEASGLALLFTDVVLPGGLSGADLALETRRRRPDIQVLFTSGYTRTTITRDGRLDAGVLLLEKPFSKAELARNVWKALTAVCSD